MRIGIHTSTTGGLHQAALRAAALGANTFQIFTSSPRMWRYGALHAKDILELRRIREENDLYPLVVHDNYLINLASKDEAIRTKSMLAFRQELERAVAIGAEYLVAHPGSYKNQTVEDGIYSFVSGLLEAVEGLDTTGVTLLLENTAGQGSALGSRFEELAEMRRLALPRTSLQIGYCLDTCHCLAAGYDVATADGLEMVLNDAQRILGLENIPVIHTNDSKGALGSHLDRHANIGEGAIGIEGFYRILNHPLLKEKAFVLETPIDQPGDDLRNVNALKQLISQGSVA